VARILILSSALGGHGGMETVMSRIASGLQARGHDISVALTGYSTVNRDWEKSLPRLHVGPERPEIGIRQNIIPIMQSLRLTISQERPDIVMATNSQSIGLAYLARLSPKTHTFQLMSWIHVNVDYLRHPRWLNLCDGHLAISSGVAQQIWEITGNEQVYLCYNPIELAVPPISRPPQGKPAHFVYMGRLANETKRIDRIIGALSDIRHLDWRWTIVGDGEDRAAIERRIGEAGLAPRVRWAGWQADPWHAVDEASALILTSDHEGFAVVLAEAAARGIPVIARDCPHGPRDIVSESQNGWLVPHNEDRVLRDILAGIIKETRPLPNPAIVRQSVRRFGTVRVLDRIEQAIEELLRRQGRHHRSALNL